MKKVAIVHHGCAKNLIDTELISGKLLEKGYEITLDAYDPDCDYIIVNTCSFIFDAEEESVRSIFDFIDTGKKVIVAGCLPQKHKKHLKKLIPEAYGFIGTSDIDKIANLLDMDKEFYYVTETPHCIYPENTQRAQITVGASSYIKIAEGCNYSCGYCVIPKLRGKFTSRPIENIVAEAKNLADKGVNEIVLIAQDTSSYGIDLYNKPSLDKLLYELDKIQNLSWIRILYTYPTNFTKGLIKAYKEIDRVVKYVDIPLQHSHPEILRAMRRPVMDYEALISKIRNKIPDVAIRTTFIVGYPGETDECFEDLYEFVKKMRFDRMGVFEFSKERNTVAYGLPHQVYAKVKKQRKNRLMRLQQKISKEINETFIGKKLPCLIEAITQEQTVIARSYRDAPEIDGLVYIETDKELIPGDIDNIEITCADDYDLYGRI